MSLNPEIASVSYRQSVARKLPALVRVLLFLMYAAVAVFTFLGTMWGFPMLVLSLGTLFFAWYYKGEVSVTYEYQIDGYQFVIRRLSGMRSRPRNIEFARLDLSRVIIVGDQNTSVLDEAEAQFQAADKRRRLTYYTSAHDPDKPGVLMYIRGCGPEEGYLLKVYLQPTGPLLDTLRMLCPGRVLAHGD